MIDWPEISAAPDLVNFAKSSTDQTYTILALQGCLRLARTPGANTVDRLALYRSVLELAKRPDEKRQALAGLADVPAAAALDMIAPYFSAASHRPGSGLMSPSIEKTPSEISSFFPG